MFNIDEDVQLVLEALASTELNTLKDFTFAEKLSNQDEALIVADFAARQVNLEKLTISKSCGLSEETKVEIRAMLEQKENFALLKEIKLE